MSRVEETKSPNQRRLLNIKNGIEGGYWVAISHQELDSLVGTLMQLLDIVGNPDQSRALKDEVKHRCRNWLDDHYDMAGYDKWQGVTDRANPVVIED